MVVGEPFNPYRKTCGLYTPDVLRRQRWVRDRDGKQRRVTPGQKELYERLVRFAGTNGRCFPSEDTLGRELGKSERQVRRDLVALESFGLMRWGRRDRRKSNSYEFLWHEVFEACHIACERTDQRPHEQFSAKEPTGRPRPLESHWQDRNVPPQPDISGDSSGHGCPPNSEHEFYTKGKSSSSSSSRTSGCRLPEDDDEDESRSLLKTEKRRPEIEHSADDLRCFAESLRDWITQSVDVLRPVSNRPLHATSNFESFIHRELPQRDLVISCLRKAPDWTVDEVLRALELNFQESPGRPKSYNWFLTTVADLYRRRNGIPPQLANRPSSSQKPPAAPQSNREPTAHERFLQRLRTVASASDKWHLQTGYQRATDVEREQIRQLLDSQNLSQAIDLSIRIIEERKEPPPRPRPAPPPMEQLIHNSARFVARHAGDQYTFREIEHDSTKYREAYRKAARQLHPDSSTGNEELAKSLGEAKTLLDQHHKLRGAA